MITWNVVAGGIILIWIFLRTYSFGVWTWKKNNHLGGAAVIVIDFIMLLIPIYLAIFRG